MAEIAIGALMLGAAYIASNQKGSGNLLTQEGYSNMKRNTNSLPNTTIPTTNYPIIRPNTGSNVNDYPNPNTPTDRYYARNVDFDKMSAGVAGGVGGVGILRSTGIPERGREFSNDSKYYINTGNGNANTIDNTPAPSKTYDEIEFGGNKTQFGDNYSKDGFQSLMGEKIDLSKFKHNNMEHYYGAKIRGVSSGANMNENLLDNKVGSGSQYISKMEQAPLFTPHDNMHLPNGMPNQNDFYQSRVVPSAKIANVKPWEEIRVGPGLDQGYGTQGTMGFNSGMESREKWIDRGVDELRVKTNPKLSYSLEGHQGPAAHYIQTAPNTETLGRMEKHLPDTYFINTPDRWFTTTGMEKGETLRPIEVDKDGNRTTTTTEYYGVTATTGAAAMYAPENYEDPKREVYDGKPMINPYAAERNTATESDFGRLSYKFTHNNRTSVRQNEMGGIHGALRAVVAPLLDVLKPSRKENSVGNLRPYENAKMPVSAGAMFNPADRAPTTIKETTVGLVGFDHLNVERQAASGYLISQNTPVETERTTTSIDYLGGAGGSVTHMGNQVYNAAYNQRNNVNKTYKNITNHGSMSLFNSNTNVQIDRLDADRMNHRTMAPTNAPAIIPSIDIHGKMTMPQSYDERSLNDRINPDILNAFRQNPYTHSLQTY